jgi:hypothetical protein
MAQPQTPPATIFFTAVLAADAHCLQVAAGRLQEIWGAFAAVSPTYPFTYTSYYAPEAGPAILRAFFAFAAPFAREELAPRKLVSNALEKELSATLNCGLPRPVNLDPGYLALDKLVLASCKDFAHRLYLRDGVFAEITLSYRGGKFVALPWTFPDYASGAYDDFFRAQRERLHRELRLGK